MGGGAGEGKSLLSVYEIGFGWRCLSRHLIVEEVNPFPTFINNFRGATSVVSSATAGMTLAASVCALSQRGKFFDCPV